MEAPRQRRRSAGGSGGDWQGLKGTRCQEHGRIELCGSPTCRSRSHRTDSRPGGNGGQASGGTSSSADRSAVSASWGEQLQEALRVPCFGPQQALTHDSDHGGSATDNQKEDSCGDASKAESAESLPVENPAPAGNGSQPNVALAQMDDDSDSDDGSRSIWAEASVMAWVISSSAGALRMVCPRARQFLPPAAPLDDAIPLNRKCSWAIFALGLLYVVTCAASNVV